MFFIVIEKLTWIQAKAKHNEQKRKNKEMKSIGKLKSKKKKQELMNFGLAVSRWHRLLNLEFTSVTDEMFIQKKKKTVMNYKTFMPIIR